MGVQLTSFETRIVSALLFSCFLLIVSKIVCSKVSISDQFIRRRNCQKKIERRVLLLVSSLKYKKFPCNLNVFVLKKLMQSDMKKTFWSLFFKQRTLDKI